MKKLNSYSVLETTLQMMGAEQYLPLFNKYGIDIKTLGLLTEDDLETIGIDDKEIQTQLVKQCKHLSKQKLQHIILYSVDDKFLLTVLKDIETHMNLLHASLSICSRRQDVSISDIKLGKGMETFVYTESLFKTELQSFQQKFLPGYGRRTRKWKYIIAIMITSTASYYTLKKYFS